MSLLMEIASNLQSKKFGLKARHSGPQSSICVRTFSLFTTFLLVSKGLDSLHCQQRHGQVTYFDQHPVQRRLVNEGTAQHRVVIGVVGDGQSVEPLRPTLIKAPLDA